MATRKDFRIFQLLSIIIHLILEINGLTFMATDTDQSMFLNTLEYLQFLLWFSSQLNVRNLHSLLLCFCLLVIW